MTFRRAELEMVEVVLAEGTWVQFKENGGALRVGYVVRTQLRWGTGVREYIVLADARQYAVLAENLRPVEPPKISRQVRRALERKALKSRWP